MPPAASPLTPAAFLARYPGIQLRLHPDRIPAGHARIFQHDMRRPEELGDLFTAFRATSRRVAVPFGTPFSRSMQLKELVSRLSEAEPGFRATFDATQQWLVKSTQPLHVDVPAYHLGGKGFLLLDGNHRAVALYRAGVPFTLTLCVLSAPIDRRILADLRYWDGGPRRFLHRTRRLRRR